jgi:hypothetical protein
LHGHDGGDPTFDEALSHPAERVRVGRSARLTGIENHKAQRVVIVQMRPEGRGIHRAGIAGVVREIQHPVVACDVVISVPNEMKHMDLMGTQPAPKLRQRRDCEAVQLNQVGVGLRAKFSLN